MTSTTKNTTTKNTTPAGTAARPVQRGHQVAVQFSAHGVQRVDVHAHASGGRGDQPYIAVTVGDCLTYLYDRDALAAHVRAWREAAAHNQSLRLPTAPAAQIAGPDGRQDVSVVCTVFGAQQHAVTVQAGQRTQVLSVVVGAVTVRVHSSAALRCYLLAWSRARALAVILDESEQLREVLGVDDSLCTPSGRSDVALEVLEERGAPGGQGEVGLAHEELSAGMATGSGVLRAR